MVFFQKHAFLRNLNSKKDTLDFNWTVNKDDLHNEAVWTVMKMIMIFNYVASLN